MNNQDFINQLSTRLKPVEPVKSPSKNFFILMGVNCAWIALGIATIGLRVDISEALREPSFWISNLIVLSLAVSAILSSLMMSIPDRHHRVIYLMPVLTAVVWLVYLIVAQLNDHQSLNHGILCLRDIVVFSFVPTAFLVKMIAKGSVLQKSIAGAFSILGGASIGALGTQFTCQDGPGIHAIVWHLGPVFLLMMVGLFLSNRLFGKN